MTGHQPFSPSFTLTQRLNIDFALQAAGLGVWELDPRTKLVNWDDRCRQLFGLTQANQLTYEQAIQFIHPHDLARVDEAVQQVLSAQSNGHYDVTYRTLGADDGILRWVRFQGKAEFNPAGEVVRFAGVAQDVSQQTQAFLLREEGEARYRQLSESLDRQVQQRTQALEIVNEELTTSNEELAATNEQLLVAHRQVEQSEEQYRLLATQLEQQVQERTEELDATNEELAASNEELLISIEDITVSNQALEAANTDLIRSNQNLEQFAYIASHDLQEPLRKIQQFSDLLQGQFGDQLGEGKAYLERIQVAAARMSGLIKDLLAFSRIATTQVTPQPVSLSQVVNRILETLSLMIEESGAHIQVDSLPTVPGDDSQLSQLFQNLLSNALKFRRTSATGEVLPPQVRIKAHLISRDELPSSLHPSRSVEAYYCLEVADNGIGFDEKYKDRIFQVFQRLHGRNEFAGTGIGLAIVQKVVTNHGGVVTASSQSGQGARFCVYLPA